MGLLSSYNLFIYNGTKLYKILHTKILCLFCYYSSWYNNHISSSCSFFLILVRSLTWFPTEIFSILTPDWVDLLFISKNEHCGENKRTYPDKVSCIAFLTYLNCKILCWCWHIFWTYWTNLNTRALDAKYSKYSKIVGIKRFACIQCSCSQF